MDGYKNYQLSCILRVLASRRIKRETQNILDVKTKCVPK